MSADRPTMREVAAAAGVSVMTVSRALRNQAVLPEDTRQRIQRIAEEIGYRPDPLVATLMAQLHGRRSNAESTVICYVTAYPKQDQWKKSPYNTETYAGAAKRATELGYALEHLSLTDNGMTPGRASRILKARGVSGLLFAPLPLPRPEKLDIRWDWFASATIGYSLGDPVLHRSMVDHTHAMRMTYRNLWELGYRRIGLVVGRNDDAEVEQKWTAGFIFEEYCHGTLKRVTPFSGSAWASLPFQKWFNKHRPDAVICVNPDVIEWIKGMGFSIPDDVGVAMPTTVYRSKYPNIAGVDQRDRLVGAISLDLVVEQLHHNHRGVPENSKAVVVEGSWSPGDSVRRQSCPNRHDLLAIA